MKIYFKLHIQGKKKAPAPPPRTISAISNGVPIATPRNVLQKLGEEEVNGKMSIVEDHSADGKFPNSSNLFLRQNCESM